MNKQLFSKLLILCAVIFAASCSDDKNEPVPAITDLSASKTNNIIFGESITLTASSSGNTFQWNSDGGTIEGSGSSVTWIAPNKVGFYTITVNNGDGSTKEQALRVVGSYFNLFDTSTSTWSISSSTTTATTADGTVTISAKTDSDLARFSYPVLSQPSLPYSYKTRVAVNADDYMAIGQKAVRFYLLFTDSQTSENYLKGLHFEVFPGLRAWQIRIGIRQASGEVNYYTEAAAEQATNIFTQNNQFRNIGMAVTANKILVINVDGAEIYRMDLSGYAGDFKLQEITYQVYPGLSLLIDDFYLTTDDTILK